MGLDKTKPEQFEYKCFICPIYLPGGSATYSVHRYI